MRIMDAKELAQILNGRTYGSEITKKEEAAAKAAGLVVVFGSSDDLVELRGAINDELYACDGATIPITPTGLVANECDDDDCPYYKKMREGAIQFKAIWNDAGNFSWTFKAPFPCETFEILDDGEGFCQGIVFALADVAKVKE